MGLLVVLSALPAAGDELAPGARERLLGHLRLAYAQATSFSPSALRYPLREAAAAEAAAARAQADDRPADLEARWKAANAADAAEDPEAGEQWRLALSLIEAQIRKTPGKPDGPLLERRARALVGADLGVRAVPAAEALLALRPDDWQAQLLAGDAYFRRADFHWRVLVRRSAGVADLHGPELDQLHADLAACRKAYDTAVDLAPAEPAPRSARIDLRLAQPLMVSFLPKWLKAPEQTDMAAVRQDLLELVSRNPGRIHVLWHAAHFFAALADSQRPPSASERAILEQGLAKAAVDAGEAVFLEEARGLTAVLRQDAKAAREAFEAALARSPGRRFAAEWLAMVEAVSTEPPAEILARARRRLEARPRAQDWTLLGMLLAEDNPVEAVAALRKALDLDVESVNARYNLGILLLQRDSDSLEARHHLQRALEQRPEDPETRLAYAVSLVLEGEMDLAVRFLKPLLASSEADASLKMRAQAALADIPAPPVKP